MPGRYIATGLYSEMVVNRGSTVFITITQYMHDHMLQGIYMYIMYNMRGAVVISNYLVIL